MKPILNSGYWKECFNLRKRKNIPKRAQVKINFRLLIKRQLKKSQNKMSAINP